MVFGKRLRVKENPFATATDQQNDKNLYGQKEISYHALEYSAEISGWQR